MKAMILAAGLGTRLKPLTNNKPKALVELKGKTLLEHAINYLKLYNFTEIVINVHHFAEQIIDYLKKNSNFGVNISISDERDMLLDTGGAISNARSFFRNEAFLVYNVDIFSNINLHKFIEQHKQHDAIVTMAVKTRKTSRQILFDQEMNLCRWKNVETGETIDSRQPVGKLTAYGFSGFQIIEPAIFELMPEEAFPLIPFYLQVAKNHNIKAYLHDESDWYEVGRYEHLQKLNQNI